MESTPRELAFTPIPRTIEIANSNKLREMFTVGGKIKYDENGKPASQDLKVVPSVDAIERFLIGQKELFPKGGATALTVEEVALKKHVGTVDDPWNALEYNFSFRASRSTEDGVQVWKIRYNVKGTPDVMKVIPSEFDFTPEL